MLLKNENESRPSITKKHIGGDLCLKSNFYIFTKISHLSLKLLLILTDFLKKKKKNAGFSYSDACFTQNDIDLQLNDATEILPIYKMSPGFSFKNSSHSSTALRWTNKIYSHFSHKPLFLPNATSIYKPNRVDSLFIT